MKVISDLNQPTLVDRSLDAVWHPCTQMKHHESFPLIAITKGKGPWLYDEQGNALLDCISSWWTNLFGHSNPQINQAITDQLEKIEHVMLAGFTHQPVVELSEKLSALTNGNLGHVFYASDGASAVEIALKMSHHFWQVNDKPNKKKFVCLENGYHGETLGALAVTDVAIFREAYSSILQEVYTVSSPDARKAKPGESADDIARHAAAELEKLFKKEHQHIAAIIIEPLVQCAGQMAMHSPEYLRLVRELCNSYDIHLIADEIAVGIRAVEGVSSGMEADERLAALHPAEEVVEIRDRQRAGGAAEDDAVELVERFLRERLGEELGEGLVPGGIGHLELLEIGFVGLLLLLPIGVTRAILPLRLLRLPGPPRRKSEVVDMKLPALPAEPFEHSFGGLDRAMAEAVGDGDDEEPGRLLRRAVGIDGVRRSEAGEEQGDDRQQGENRAKAFTVHRRHTAPRGQSLARGERLEWSARSARIPPRPPRWYHTAPTAAAGLRRRSGRRSRRRARHCGPDRSATISRCRTAPERRGRAAFPPQRPGALPCASAPLSSPPSSPCLWPPP